MRSATLTDTFVASLPMSETGQYIVRDTVLSGFFVDVGKGSKAFTMQAAVTLASGKRSSRRRVIGKFGDISTRSARTLAKQSMAETSSERNQPSHSSPIGFSDAWENYERFLNSANRSHRTIDGYQKHIKLYFSDWLGKDLIELARHPEVIVRTHEALTKNNGPYATNSATRTFSAIYNNTAKTQLELRGL